MSNSILSVSPASAVVVAHIFTDACKNGFDLSCAGCVDEEYTRMMREEHEAHEVQEREGVTSYHVHHDGCDCIVCQAVDLRDEDEDEDDVI